MDRTCRSPAATTSYILQKRIASPQPLLRINNTPATTSRNQANSPQAPLQTQLSKSQAQPQLPNSDMLKPVTTPDNLQTKRKEAKLGSAQPHSDNPCCAQQQNQILPTGAITPPKDSGTAVSLIKQLDKMNMAYNELTDIYKK